MTSPPPGGGRPVLEAGLPASDPLAARLLPPMATGVEWGLDRTRRLLSRSGDPHLRYPVLHVGGTNGKGSVSAILASVLRASGLRVGLYTSPHLCSFAERIQVDGAPASPEALTATADELREALQEEGPTFFEAATVLALTHFARTGVDAAVLEVGLGGRLDSTNVVRPLVTAITNVALDHAEYLGPTTLHIAREKVGIAKPGIPLVTAEEDPGVLAVLRGEAEAVGAPFHVLHGGAAILDPTVALDHTAFTLETGPWGRLRLRTPLVGMHQAVNAALAVRVLEHLPPELRPTRAAVEEGVARVRWPGRMQVEEVEGVRWILDVAHNVAGAAALAEALERLALDPPRVVLAGVLGDKDWKGMLPPVFRGVERAILTQPPSAPLARRWDPEQAAREVREAGVSTPLEIETDFQRALTRAGELARGGTVVVTGSCHTVGDALAALGRAPYPLDPPPSPGEIGSP